MFGFRTPIADAPARPAAGDDSGEAQKTMFGLRALSDNAFDVPPTPLDAGVSPVGRGAGAGEAWGGGVPVGHGPGDHGPGSNPPVGRGPSRLPVGAPSHSHTMVGLAAYVSDDGGPAPTALDAPADDWMDDIQDFIDEKVADGTLDVPQSASASASGSVPVAPGMPPRYAEPVARAEVPPIDTHADDGVAGFGIVRRARAGGSRPDTGHAPVATAGTVDHQRLWEEASEHRRERISDAHNAITQPISIAGDERLRAPAAPEPAPHAPAWQGTARWSPTPGAPGMPHAPETPAQQAVEPTLHGMQAPDYGFDLPPQGSAEHAANFAFLDAPEVEAPAPAGPEIATAYQPNRPIPPPVAARAPSVSEDLLSVAAKQRLPAATGSVARPMPTEPEPRRFALPQVAVDPKWIAVGAAVVLAVAAFVLLAIVLSGGTVSDAELTPPSETATE